MFKYININMAPSDVQIKNDTEQDPKPPYYKLFHVSLDECLNACATHNYLATICASLKNGGQIRLTRYYLYLSVPL